MENTRQRVNLLLKATRKCLFCEKQFKFKYQYEYFNHLRVHTREKPNFCVMCSSEFLKRFNLTTHQDLHLSKELRIYKKCPKCPKQFKTKELLKAHVANHVNDRPYICHICSKSYRKLSVFNVHLKFHAEVRPFRCNLCPGAFFIKSHLTKHVMSVHEKPERHKCYICAKSFTLKYTFDCHMRQHTGEKPFNCDSCNKSFAIKHQLNAHKKIVHSSELQQTCNICGTSLRNTHYLLNHVKVVHGESKKEKLYKCSMCNKTFRCKISLYDHLNLHTGVKPYPCQTCEKFFVSKTSRYNHMKRVHNASGKIFACHMCPHKFRCLTNLKAHYKHHYNLREHTCLFCNKGFNVSSSMGNHIASHTREKPWICYRCGREYATNAGLKGHQSLCCR